jgi:hypothetical protein
MNNISDDPAAIRELPNSRNWNQPKRPRPADEFVQEICIHLRRVEQQKKRGQAVRIMYAGSFGVMRVSQVTPKGRDFLRIVVRDDEGVEHSIFAPVSQCSFMFSLFVPTAKEPEQKIILGFAEGQS